MLFCKPIEGLQTMSLSRQLCSRKTAGICIYGAQAMSSRHNNLQALVKTEFPGILWTHCIIHREDLASKALNPEFTTVFTVIIAIVK